MRDLRGGGVDADVVGRANGDLPQYISIPEDGSRVYFTSAAHLLAGTPPAGQSAVYRVMVGSGELALLGAFSERIGFSTRPISADGSRMLFTSLATALNQLGGTQNGAKEQAYLYNDEDRSLSCMSCPSDGSAPLGEVNEVKLSVAGDNAAFATPTPLLSADQNTSPVGEDPVEGTDIYEWRDERLIMATDGRPSGCPIRSRSRSASTRRAVTFLHRLGPAHPRRGGLLPAPL